MIYSVTKFRHDLLVCHFFFMENTKSSFIWSSRHVSMDGSLDELSPFKVIVHESKDLVLPDHFSRISSREDPTGVDDKAPDVALFTVDIIPEWASDVVNLIKRCLPGTSTALGQPG